MCYQITGTRTKRDERSMPGSPERNLVDQRPILSLGPVLVTLQITVASEQGTSLPAGNRHVMLRVWSRSLLWSFHS